MVIPILQMKKLRHKEIKNCARLYKFVKTEFDISSLIVE